jgi:hypothetical protein
MAKNLGRKRNVLTGWQGVVPGGTATLSIPLNGRFHRLILQCQGIYFSAVSGVALPMAIIKAANPAANVGSNTITPTIVNNQVTALTFAAGATASTNFTAGDLVGFIDPTGCYSYAVVGLVGGAVSWITVTAASRQGIACPLDPRILFTSFHQLVNSNTMRDVSASTIIGICEHYGYVPQTGSLPIFYTEPWRNWLKEYCGNSWDVTGQNTFQIQAGINPNVVNPAIYGTQEFDNFRNARTCTAQNQAYLGTNPTTGQPWAIGATVPFLDPITQHEATFNINAGGSTDITTLNFGNQITKLYGIGTSPGNIYRVDLLADNVLIMQDLACDNYEANAQYGLQTGNKIYAPQAGGGGFNGLSGGLPSWATISNTPTTTPNGPLNDSTGSSSSPFAWDFVLAFDVAGRDWEGLNVSSGLILRVYSNATQVLKVVTEARPRQFTG